MAFHNRPIVLYLRFTYIIIFHSWAYFTIQHIYRYVIMSHKRIVHFAHKFSEYIAAIFDVVRMYITGVTTLIKFTDCCINIFSFYKKIFPSANSLIWWPIIWWPIFVINIYFSIQFSSLKFIFKKQQNITVVVSSIYCCKIFLFF